MVHPCGAAIGGPGTERNALLAGAGDSNENISSDTEKSTWFFNAEKPRNSADVVKETQFASERGLNRNLTKSLRHGKEKRITMHSNMMLLGKTMDFTAMPIYVLLECQLNLCASLVSSRNSQARMEVEDRLGLTVEQASRGTRDDTLPDSLRSAFARYVLGSGVDIQPRYEQPRLHAHRFSNTLCI